MGDRDHDPVARAVGPVPVSPLAGAADRFDALLDRVGLRGEVSRDAALAVVVAAVSVGLLWSLLDLLVYLEGAVLPPATGIALTAAFAAQSLLLVVRRRYPVRCLLGGTAGQVLVLALLPPEVGLQGFALFIAAYTCGTRLPVLRLTAAVTGASALYGLGGALVQGALAPSVDLPPVPDDPVVTWLGVVFSVIPTFVLPALAGAYVGTRRRYTDLLRVRADEEIRAQLERAESAIRSERTRMARELHDIAAHHLSGMVVQAGAAERLVGRDDDAAREAMAWVRSQGKETLASLRSVVGALRDPGEDGRGDGADRGAPVPGLSALDRLVGAERELGTEIEVVREGDPYGLAPIADVTAYRAVQEALTNARDHAAGARVLVRLGYGPDRFALEVENGPGGSRETGREHRGLGVLGMRERAQVVGAALEVGPTQDGGWRVRWEMPVNGDER
ncbi:sensor histidine kinase [Nocardiopsis sp. CC223A]|uniref:sensor histidine kinase n=1 Tax=Nocardiopsis sp. CC223A TaxID=3044051 RepID=UPI00278C0146|nr:histidine kinase [Nocardiopsis sp. CC223A]